MGVQVLLALPLKLAIKLKLKKEHFVQKLAKRL
jgi:hypothetical protein